MDTLAASSFWLSYVWGGNAALLCGDGPNLAYSRSCYNSVGQPLQFSFSVWNLRKGWHWWKLIKFLSGKFNRDAFTTYTLTCKLCEHPASPTHSRQQAGRPHPSDVLSTAHAPQSGWTHTVGLQSTSSSQGNQQTCIAFQAILKEILEILLFLPQKVPK